MTSKTGTTGKPNESAGGESRVIPFDAVEVLPPEEAVLDHQGIPASAKVPERISALHDEAVRLFAEVARPIGMLMEIARTEFGALLGGEGNNAEDVLIARIYPDADRLALFAATMGQAVSERIEALFAGNEFALGSMLDSVASQAADRAAEELEVRYRDELDGSGLIKAGHTVMGYSPGYCGWHISGQRALFDRLRPDQIGISLNESFLMSPLKSVSGVLVAADIDSHMFIPGFSYCPHCKDRSCLERMERLRAERTAREA